MNALVELDGDKRNGWMDSNCYESDVEMLRLPKIAKAFSLNIERALLSRGSTFTEELLTFSVPNRALSTAVPNPRTNSANQLGTDFHGSALPYPPLRTTHRNLHPPAQSTPRCPHLNPHFLSTSCHPTKFIRPALPLFSINTRPINRACHIVGRPQSDTRPR